VTASPASSGRGQEPLELCRPSLDHGPDQGAGHVPEEAVRLDLELEGVTPPVPGCVLHDAREDFVVRLSGGERPEIVLPDQQVGRFGKRLLVKRPWIPPAPALLERRGLRRL
jgi:hypothetical protein